MGDIHVSYLTRQSKGYIEKIEKKKKVLREPRSTADTEAVLDEFARHINNNYAAAQCIYYTRICIYYTHI